eukprot:scaffold11643_cov73-Skeletonema_dohrnii-CCMP3373.AAC.1
MFRLQDVRVRNSSFARNLAQGIFAELVQAIWSDEGKKVWTASIDDVAWVEFEHFPEPPKGKAKRFRLAPQKFTATITFNIVKGLTTENNFKVGNATVTQTPVNSNVATTGHKLRYVQGYTCCQ